MYISKKNAVSKSDSCFVIKTHEQQWVIPNNVSMMKLLIEDQSIRPRDLQFSSTYDSQTFIKKLLLLALKDEYKSLQPSPLARFARDLINPTLN